MSSSLTFTLTGTACPTDKNKLFAIFLGDVRLKERCKILQPNLRKTRGIEGSMEDVQKRRRDFSFTVQRRRELHVLTQR